VAAGDDRPAPTFPLTTAENIFQLSKSVLRNVYYPFILDAWVNFARAVGSRILRPNDAADSRMAEELSAAVWDRFFVTAGTARTVIGAAVSVKAHLIASAVQQARFRACHRPEACDIN
jgi:type IV secretory pathway TraG/TraD family ATPase VirD4